MSAAGWAGCFLPSSRRPRPPEGFSTTCRTPLAEAPPVLRQHNVADRVELLEGSFFDSVPTGGDVYVLKMILHDWPDDKAVEILQSVRSAAKVGTKVLVIDCVIPDHDREFFGHWTDLEMLLTAGWTRTNGAGVPQSPRARRIPDDPMWCPLPHH